LLLGFYQSDQERPDHLSGLEALFISHAGYFPMEIVRYANAECFHCGCVCDSNRPASQQKNCGKFICDTLQLMKKTKPKTQFSVRLPEEVITLLDEIAANTGLNITRNNVVEQACEWFVRTYRANGDRSLTEADMRDLEAFLIERLAPGKALLKSQPDSAGVKTLRASASLDSTPSTATTKSSHTAG
jgi:hypothetical protein